jgi:hypothetical protein
MRLNFESDINPRVESEDPRAQERFHVYKGLLTIRSLLNLVGGGSSREPKLSDNELRIFSDRAKLMGAKVLIAEVPKPSEPGGTIAISPQTDGSYITFDSSFLSLEITPPNYDSQYDFEGYLVTSNGSFRLEVQQVIGEPLRLDFSEYGGIQPGSKVYYFLAKQKPLRGHSLPDGVIDID